MGEWSSRFHAGFLGSDATQANPQGSLAFRLRDYHPLWSPVPVTLLAVWLGFTCNPARSCMTEMELLTTPQEQRMQPITHLRFGLFPVRSPLLRESLLISLPPGTEMLHFPGFASRAYSVRPQIPRLHRGGLPHSGIHGSVPARRLPVAYRSLPRPSSPPTAKASTICSY